MVGLGPRVGGAHVDVNLQFDDKSVATVGKKIHKQLSKLGNSLAEVGERNREIYQAIGRDSVTAWRSLLGTIVAGAPLIGSAISAVAGAATLLADALYRVAQSGYAAGPVLTSIGVAAGTAFLGLQSFFKALKDGDLSGLTPSAQAAARAVQGLGDAWGNVRDEVQERMFANLADDISRLSTTLLPTLQRGLGKMADSLNGLAQDMLDYVNSSAGLRVINRFLDNNAEIFARLSQAVIPFLDGFLRLMNALSPAAKRLADRITEVAQNFQGWTKGEGFAKRMDDMMKKAEKTAGLVIDVVVNLGKALNNIFNAANPATNQFLQMLVDLTERFAEWSGSVEGQNSIATWASQSVDVMRQFGKTLEAAFEVIAELADPRVITSFLKTVEGAFEYLSKLPLDKIVNAFVTLSETLQPVSSLFLAIIIAGAAFNIMLGSLIGQIGGLFSVLANFLKFRIIINLFKGMGGGANSAGTAAAGAAQKVGFFTRVWQALVKVFGKVRSAFSAVTGLFTKTSATTGQAASGASKLSSAFKPVLSIIGRFAKFAGWAGIAIWIGTIIAKSKDLQAKLGELWDAFKGVFSSLGTAFAEIGEALKPLAPAAEGAGKAFGFIFDIVDKIAEFALGVLIDMWIYAFESLSNVIEGAGKIIAGFINILVGLFTLDFGKMWDGLKQMAEGIVPLLKGMFGLFVTMFAPARLAKFGLGIVKGLGGGIAKAVPGLLTTVGKFVADVLKFFASLPLRLLKLGGEAIVNLGKAVAAKAPGVIAAAGRMVLGFLRWYVSLPKRLFNLGLSALKRLGDSVAKGTPKVLSHARKVVEGVIDYMVKLPGRLFELGKNAMTKLGSAIKSGVGSLKDEAGKIVTAVVDTIAKLPSKLLNLGKSLLSAGKTLGGKILEGIRSGITAIGDMAGSVASSLKTGINNAIGLPKDLSFKVLGKKIGFTIPGFARGGVAPGGLITVGEEGPELMAPPRGSRIYSNKDSQRMMGSSMPKRMVLRIGDRDFLAYVEEIADSRIDAADSLAWQGA